MAWDGQGTAQHTPQLRRTDAHPKGSILCRQGSMLAAARRRTQCACARGFKPRPPGPTRLGCNAGLRVLSPAQGPEFDPSPLRSYLVSLCNPARVPNSSLFCNRFHPLLTGLPYLSPSVCLGWKQVTGAALCPGRDVAEAMALRRVTHLSCLLSGHQRGLQGLGSGPELPAGTEAMGSCCKLGRT